MIKRILMILSTALLLCAQAHANSGQMLLEALDAEDPELNMIGEAYVTGVYEAGITLGEICLVGGITHDQVVSGVYFTLKGNPEMLHLHASALVLAIVRNAMPCTLEPDVEPWSPEYKRPKESI